MTVPYVSLGPGPTFDTLGEVDGKQVVDIEGTDVHPTSGHLNMTTVSQRDDLTLGQALTLWMSGREQLVPRDLVYPPDKSKDEIDQANTTDFKQLRGQRGVRGAELPEVPVGGDGGRTSATPARRSASCSAATPSTRVNGKPVANLDAVHRAAEGHQTRRQRSSSTTAARTRRRASPPSRLGSNPDRDYGYLGVGVLDAPWAPFSIDFNLANIGGPSAGLMFSLAVVDKLTTGDLNDGKFVAGTGTIDSDGKVGSIGGITHKMLAAREAGATVFLVPADNCDEAKTAHEDGLQLVKVDNLGQAVDALHALSAGGEPPRC